MEDDLRKNIKWKTTSKKQNEDDLKKMKKTYKINGKKMKTTSKYFFLIEDNLKKNPNHFLIPLKFRGKPSLGLAQLSKILSSSMGQSKRQTIALITSNIGYQSLPLAGLEVGLVIGISVLLGTNLYSFTVFSIPQNLPSGIHKSLLM